MIQFSTNVARGAFDDHVPVNKFGRAPSGVQTSRTTIWDRADAAPTQQVWVPPTQARTHAIVSTSANDTALGTGARTVRVWGLTAWDTPEVFEDVTMNGTTPVNTVNQYVIIHRKRVLTCGSAGPNVGTITATAATDATVTSAIRPTIGSTAMAIYGWPSGQKLILMGWHASIMQSSGQASDVICQLFHNPDPENYPALDIERDVRGVASAGSSGGPDWLFSPPLRLDGPGILKISGVGTTADRDLVAGFGAILVTER